MNDDMLPVDTTVHINPEDIKWDGGDLISRSALKKSIKSYADDQYAENEYLGEYAIMDIIDNTPAVKPDEIQAIMKDYLVYRCEWKRPQGKWIEENSETGALGIKYTWVRCNQCGWDNSLVIPKNFCPNCGADMRSVDKGLQERAISDLYTAIEDTYKKLGGAE